MDNICLTIIGDFNRVTEMIISKRKSQKYWTPKKIQNRMSLIKWQNQKHIHIKRSDINCNIPDLVHNIFLCKQWWIEHGFIASYTSHLYDSRIKFHYMYIENDAWTKQTDIIGKISIIGEQQSTLWQWLNQVKLNCLLILSSSRTKKIQQNRVQFLVF